MADTIALPPNVVAAIHAVSRELSDLPRECIRDSHLLVRWLAARGRKLDAVARSRIVLPTPWHAPALPSPLRPIARAAACEALQPAAAPPYRDRRAAWRQRLIELGQLVLPF